ncbi:hypothetical protein MN116_003965 [Schistosoma mekongi]|uniref:One cut domain family member n=1 Tax=Schistosoma mekongi TaxID=38744 RepID=A0AAE1ZER9_SCHME|nr:hypothetical protein MN116_003965 [Schistosoma mekongi]
MSKNVENLKQEHSQDNISNEKYQNLCSNKFETIYLIDSTKQSIYPLSKNNNILSEIDLSTSIIDVNQLHHTPTSMIDFNSQTKIQNFLPFNQLVNNNSLSSHEYTETTQVNSIPENNNILTNPQTVSFQLLSNNVVNSSNTLIDNENTGANINVLTNQQSTTSLSSYMKLQNNYMIKPTIDSPHDLSFTNSTTSSPQTISKQVKLTNDYNTQNHLTDHLEGITSSYIDESGQKHILTTSYNNQSKLKQQSHIQDPRIELNFICNHPMISSSLNDYSNNNNNNTTETQLPSSTNSNSSISEQYVSNLSTDLTTTSFTGDSKIVPVSNVMSYIYQHGSLNHSNTEQLRSLNCLNLRTLNHWNSLEFNLNGSVDPLTNYGDLQVYHPNVTIINNNSIPTSTNSNNNDDNNHNVIRINDINDSLKHHQSSQKSHPLQQLQNTNNSILSNPNNNTLQQTNNLKSYSDLIAAFNLEDMKLGGFHENNNNGHIHANPKTSTTLQDSITSAVTTVGFSDNTPVNHQTSHANDVNMKNTANDNSNISNNDSRNSNGSNSNNNTTSNQPRVIPFIENSNYRSNQSQSCYNYNHSEFNCKPDIKYQTSGIQHTQGQLCRPVFMNGSLVPSHMTNETLSLQKALSNMHSRHDIISHSIQEMEEINTKVLAQRISSELKRYSIPQAVFAQRILCRSQGTLSDLLRNPKPWSKLKSGRETFRRMWKWLQEPEYQRMSALRLAESDLRYTGPVVCKRKELEHIKLSESRQAKKPRLVFTDIQRRTLQAIFKETKRPSKEMQSTIAQQLGLQVSTVANFFMNARRRSLDKWQEDTSKPSSTVNSPSDSSYSREHGEQGQQLNVTITSNNLCYSKDDDININNCTPYSPLSRRHLGCSLPISASVSTLKTLDNNFIPGSQTELGKVTRCNSLDACNSFTKPMNQLSLNSNLARTAVCNNNSTIGLFKCENPGSNIIHSEHHHAFNALNSINGLSTIQNVMYTPQNSTPVQHHQQQQPVNTGDLSNNYPLHLASQIQHPFQHHLQQPLEEQHLNPPLSSRHHHHHLQSLSHPMNAQLVSPSSSVTSSSHHLSFPSDMLDHNNSTTGQIQSAGSNSRLHNSNQIDTIHGNNLLKSIYPYSNSQTNYAFPVSGNFHSHHSHLDLLHTTAITNNNSNSVNVPYINGAYTMRNHFLMRDLTGSPQFDHRFFKHSD